MSNSEKINIRKICSFLHRDLGFFFTGLIISFALSGIALNHRASWNPSKYVFHTETVKTELPGEGESFDEAFCKKAFEHLGMNKDFRGVRVRGRNVRIYYKNGIININKRTGEGELEAYKKRPLLGQMVQLHLSANSWWIWFSDLFALSLIIITITGLMLNRGKNGFRYRGWKLMVSGLVVPVVFVLFIL